MPILSVYIFLVSLLIAWLLMLLGIAIRGGDEAEMLHDT
jgi:hypothetical protein